MQQLLHAGVGVRTHHMKGVYTLSVGGMRSLGKLTLGRPAAESLCTFRRAKASSDEAENDAAEEAPRRGDASPIVPISLRVHGCEGTLRPWDPDQCFIAAGMHKNLLQLPIFPGRSVYVVDCPMVTLSHIADIIGIAGQVIAVWDKHSPSRPTKSEKTRFIERYPRSILTAVDVAHLSSEYIADMMLGLPPPCKRSLLMALHPRVGAGSPVHKLRQAKEPAAIFQRIFGFLQRGDMAHVTCMVWCYWPPNSQQEAIRDVMLRHLDIVKRWRTPQSAEGPAAAHAPAVRAEGRAHVGPAESWLSGRRACRKSEASPAASSTQPATAPQPEVALHWLMMLVPLAELSTECRHGDWDLLGQVKGMKRTETGRRTGLLRKEWVRLDPYFPGLALLLLKYHEELDQREAGAPPAAAAATRRKAVGASPNK